MSEPTIKQVFQSALQHHQAGQLQQAENLYRQILAGRELQDPLIIIVLGDDDNVVQAVNNIVYNRGIRGQEAEEKISYMKERIEQLNASMKSISEEMHSLVELHLSA